MYNIKDDIELHHKRNAQRIKKESALTMFLGFWVLVLPVLIGHGYGRNTINTVSWNFTLTGIFVVIFSFLSLRFLRPWSLWLTFAMGAWLMVSPLLLGFLGETWLVLSSIVLGFIIMASAAKQIPKSERPFYSKYLTKDYHH